MLSMRLLAVASIVAGVTAFCYHGGQRLTAAGLYCLTAGVMAGGGSWYWAAHAPTSTTQLSVFVAACSIYVTTVFMYLFWWHNSVARVPKASPARPPALSYSSAHLVSLLGIALFVVGIGLQQLHVSLGTLSACSADVGCILFIGALLLGPGARAIGSPLRLVVIVIVLIAYYALIFGGGGRLRLLTLVVATALIAQYRFRKPIKILGLCAVVPTLIAFGLIGQQRVAEYDNPDLHASANGLGSLVNPITTYAQLIHEHVTNGHGSTLLAELVTIVPRDIWPSKPEQFGRVLALNLRPHSISTNLSLPCMPQGEWYFNFGWIGLIAMIAVLGFLVRWLDRGFAKCEIDPTAPTASVLKLVALIILVASMTDLAWGGTPTWGNRNIQRLLILLPFAIWLYVTRSRSSAHVRTPMRSARVTRSPRRARTPSILARVKPAHSRAVAAIADEAASSLQNYVVLFAALHLLSIGEVGRFTLAYTGITLAEIFLKSLVLTPLNIHFAAETSEAQRRAGSAAAGASLIAGCIVLALTVALTPLYSAQYRDLIIACGIAALALTAQEVWREYFFTIARPWRAALNDVWCLVVTVVIVWIAVVYGAPSPTDLVLLLALGTGAGFVFGVVQTGIRPRFKAGWRWIEEHWALGLGIAGSRGVTQLAGRASLALITAICGAVEFGRFAASRTLITPATTVMASLSRYSLPEATRMQRRGDRRYRAFLAATSIVLAAGVLLIGLIVAMLPDGAGHLLAGKNWGVSKELLLPVLVWAAANGLQQGARVGLLVHVRPGLSFRISVTTGIEVLIAAIIGAYAGGVTGAAWALAIVQIVQVLPWWISFLRISRHSGAATDSKSPPRADASTLDV